VRIGDDHFGSFRAARAPSGNNLPHLFVADVLLFWIAAAGIQVRRRAMGLKLCDPWCI
jgi:hypothetical protein